MSEWKEKSIAEICNVKGGKRLPAGKEFSNGVTAFPYLRVTDMVDGSIDEASLVYVPEDIEPLIRNYKISKDDIYVTIAGTLGMFGTIPAFLDKAQLTENAAKLCNIDLARFDKLFLKYYLNSENVQTQIRSQIGVGGGVPKLALFRIENLKVHFPEKTEQIKIAKVLSTIDAVIKKTQAAIEKYNAIKKGILHDLFTRGIDAVTGQLRPSYMEAPDLYQETKLGWLPKEWEADDLKSCCDLITDGSHFSPKPIEDGAIIVNVKDMREYEIDYDGCTRISKKEFSLLSAQNCSPKKGDILLSKDGTVGRILLFEGDREVVVLSSIAIIRPSEKIKSSYLYSFFKSSQFLEQLILAMSGSALRRIVLRDINNLSISYPKKELEQSAIAQKVIQLEQKMKLENDYLYKLQQMKQGLMGDLLSGKKRVQVEEEEKEVMNG